MNVPSTKHAMLHAEESDVHSNDSDVLDSQPDHNSDHDLIDMDTEVAGTDSYPDKNCITLLSQSSVKPAFKPGGDYFVTSDSQKPHYVEREQTLVTRLIKSMDAWD